MATEACRQKPGGVFGMFPLPHPSSGRRRPLPCNSIACTGARPTATDRPTAKQQQLGRRQQFLPIPPCLSSERDAEVRSERRSETGMTPTGGRTRANGRNRAQATSLSFPAHCRTAVYSMDRPTDLTRMGVARPRSSSPATQKPKLR